MKSGEDKKEMIFRPVSFGGLITPLLAAFFYLIYKAYPAMDSILNEDACEWLLLLMTLGQIMWAIVALNKEYQFEKHSNGSNVEVVPSRIILVVGAMFMSLEGLLFTHHEMNVPYLFPPDADIEGILSTYVAPWLVLLICLIIWIIALGFKAYDRYYGIDRVMKVEINTSEKPSDGKGDSSHFVKIYRKRENFNCFLAAILSSIIALVMYFFDQTRPYVNHTLLVFLVIQVVNAFSNEIKPENSKGNSDEKDKGELEAGTRNKDNSEHFDVSSLHLRVLYCIGGILIAFIGIVYTCMSLSFSNDASVLGHILVFFKSFNACWIFSIMLLVLCIWLSYWQIIASSMEKKYNTNFTMRDPFEGLGGALKHGSAGVVLYAFRRMIGWFKKFISSRLIPIAIITVAIAVYCILPWTFGNEQERVFVRWVDGVENLLAEYSAFNMDRESFMEAHKDNDSNTQDNGEVSSESKKADENGYTETYEEPTEEGAGIVSEITGTTLPGKSHTEQNTDDKTRGSILQDIVNYSLIYYALFIILIGIAVVVLKIIPALTRIIWEDETERPKQNISKAIMQYYAPLLILIAAFSFLRVFNGRDLDFQLMQKFIEESFYVIGWIMIGLIALDAVRLMLNQLTSSDTYLRQSMHSIYCVIADVVFRSFMSFLSGVGRRAPVLIKSIFTVFLYSDEDTEKRYDGVENKIKNLFDSEVKTGETSSSRIKQFRRKKRDEWRK